MADLRPLHGLRYQPAVAGDIGNVIAPPYDVISDEAQRALYERSPFNVVRVEYGLDAAEGDGNRYQRAADTLASWRRGGVLAADPHPSLYLYEQEFAHAGRTYRRRAILGRVRLEPWENGVILPHEHTMSGPKQDRIRLLRACRTNVSPIYALYRPDDGAAIAICAAAAGDHPDVEARDSLGQTHRLWVIDDARAVQRLEYHFSSRTLYIADGHHRYETALGYREERKAAENQWSGDEPENFALMALTAADDPGLLVLPIHRLVRPAKESENLRRALADTFDLSDLEPIGARAEALPRLLARLERLQRENAVDPAFVVLGLGRQPTLLRLRDRPAVAALMPEGHSQAWKQLSVNVLQYGILDPLLGIDIETVRGGEHVFFTEDAEEAWHRVEQGEVSLAFLLNGTRPEEIIAVADAGDRMPQKSTFFYPKLGTGLVLYSMDAHPATEASAV